MRRLWLVGVLLALAVGAALRLACASAEFWLDEAWSSDLARQCGSLAGVFRCRHDNNHHLNTAWLLLCPAGASDVVLRLHSLAAGLLTVALAAAAARRWGRADAACAALLTAGCYWLVLASAEARGYALACCFALAALLALGRFLDGGGRLALAGFWAASAAGFLSHLTFVHAYLGFVAWSLRRRAAAGASPRDELGGLLRLHGVPGAFFAAFYWVSLRGMEVGGGPPAGTAGVLVRLLGAGLGGPAGGLEAVPWVLAAALLFAAGLALLARARDDSWVFFAVAVVASPALFLARRPPFLFERYFLVSFLFFLLLAARVLGALWRAGGPRRLFAACALTAFLAGSLAQVRGFVHAGRGEFRSALAFVAAADPAAVVRVSGDHDFRVRKYVEFHARRLPGGREVEYVSREALPAAGVRWLFVHRPDDQHPPPEVDTFAGRRYRLAAAYPSRGPACWGWFVYEREGDCLPLIPRRGPRCRR